MNNMPLVSVLMTAFNREQYIAEAIESVLASSYINFELIIVDDCSIDNTVEIAKTYEAKDTRIKVYINEVNLGDYPNRNRAASYSKGKYLKYVDSDDLLYPYSLWAMVNFMESKPNAAMAFGSNTNSTKTPFPFLLEPTKSLRYHFFKQNFLDSGPTATIIKREIFEQLGGYSGKRMVSDIEFGLKCASQYHIIIMSPGLVFWREHGNQEVFIGIENNLYAPMMEEILGNFIEKLPLSILDEKERKKILQTPTFFSRLKTKIKILIK
jgi:glycosyltransferase involved in cell wall biosynthesis